MLNTVFNLIGSRGRPAFSPLLLSPDFWFKADAGTFQTVSGSPASADNDPVGSYLDNSARGNNAVQATAISRPVLKLNIANGLPMLFPGNAASNLLNLTVPVTYTGAFTVYAVGTRADSSNWIPLSGASTLSALLLFGTNEVYCINDAGDFVVKPYTGSTGTIIIRFRRGVDGVYKFAATGMPEITVGEKPGPITLDTMFARPNSSQGNDGTNKHGEMIGVAADVLTDTPALDAATISYLQTRWGVTLP